MTMRADWQAAKKDSKAKFALAQKAKRDALEKQIKAGDAKARKKVMDENLAQLGIADSPDDVDKYFKFKEDLGPNLDKLEKAGEAMAEAQGKLQALTSIDTVIADAKLSKAFAAVAPRLGIDDFWAFCSVGWKSDPAKAVPVFIAQGGKLEINIDEQFLRPLRAIADNPAQLKAQGPALLAACRKQLILDVQSDAMSKFRNTPECRAVYGIVDLTPLKTRVTDVVDSYRAQIKLVQPKWKGVAPDFCTPLLNALDAIAAGVRNL